MAVNSPIDEQLLEDLYGWVDEIPLSRPKKNIQRDFSDGVLVAEIIHHYCPKLVELHNYPPASKIDKKISNWSVMNRKVFKKLGFELANDVVANISNCKPWAVEQFLMLIRRKIDRYLYEQGRSVKGAGNQSNINDKPEADQAQISGRGKGPSGYVPSQPETLKRDLNHPTATTSYVAMQQTAPYPSMNKLLRGDMVPKVLVEEKEQEILTKEETIQILQAKVRRLEHLLHLKDIRIDDLQGRMENLEKQYRPTGGPGQQRPTATKGNFGKG